jgi:HEAT repeat protein
MQNKRHIALTALAVAALCGLACLVLRSPPEKEPVSQGKPLSYWLAGYDSGNYRLAHPNGPSPPTHGEANFAIRQMGTNAIPTLLRMLEEHDPSLRERVLALTRKQHFIKIPYMRANRGLNAYSGFHALGPEAVSAVPALLGIFDRDQSAFSQQAIPAILASIGPGAAEAIPALLKATTHTNAMVRNNAVWALRRIHSAPAVVVPALTKCLSDPDAQVRMEAARALAAFEWKAESAVPALLDLWRKEPPRRNLGSFDSVVSASWATAVPGPGTPDVRGAAADALQSIDPEAANKAGIEPPVQRWGFTLPAEEWSN